MHFGSVQSDCRPNSAYMLFYERCDELEPVSSVPMQISPPSFAPLQAETPSEVTPMVRLAHEVLPYTHQTMLMFLGPEPADLSS